jgi:hypothetical protein
MTALSEEWQQVTANGIIHAATQMAQEIVAFSTDPHVLMRPKVFIDGNQWCALYGDNLQDGVAGFGKYPGAAMVDFNKNWYASLAGETAGKGE